MVTATRKYLVVEIQTHHKNYIKNIRITVSVVSLKASIVILDCEISSLYNVLLAKEYTNNLTLSITENFTKLQILVLLY